MRILAYILAYIVLFLDDAVKLISTPVFNAIKRVDDLIEEIERERRQKQKKK